MTEQVQAQGFMLKEDSLPSGMTVRDSGDKLHGKPKKELYEYLPQLNLKCLFYTTY